MSTFTLQRQSSTAVIRNHDPQAYIIYYWLFKEFVDPWSVLGKISIALFLFCKTFLFF